jgi:hypothetical protein
MYALPASLFGLPPPRRRVTRGKFALAGRGHPLVMLLRAGTTASVLQRGGDARQGCSCGEGTPASVLLQRGDARQSYACVFLDRSFGLNYNLKI